MNLARPGPVLNGRFELSVRRRRLRAPGGAVTSNSTVCWKCFPFSLCLPELVRDATACAEGRTPF